MKIQDYLNLKLQIKEAQSLERETRLRIIDDACGGHEGEGVKNGSIDDWDIKATLKKSYKFLRGSLKLSEKFDPRSYLIINDDNHDSSNSGKSALQVASELNIPKSLFNFSISLNLREYRKLNSDQKLFIDQFIEVKQEAPTLNIKNVGLDED